MVTSAEVNEMAQTEDIDGLIHALSDENSGTRATAAFHLGNLGAKQAVEPLINTLGEIDSSIQVAEALGKIGDRVAIEPLSKTLFHDWWSAQKPNERPRLYQKMESIMNVLKGFGKEGEDAIMQGLVAIYVQSSTANNVYSRTDRQRKPTNP